MQLMGVVGAAAAVRGGGSGWKQDLREWGWGRGSRCMGAWSELGDRQEAGLGLLGAESQCALVCGGQMGLDLSVGGCGQDLRDGVRDPAGRESPRGGVKEE